MNEQIRALTEAYTERITAAINNAVQEQNFEGLGEEITQAFDDYFAELQQVIQVPVGED